MKTTKFESVTPDNYKLPFNCILHTRTDAHQIFNHWHDTYEIDYVFSGQNENFYLDGKVFNQRPHEIVCVNPYEIHGMNLSKDKKRLAMTIMVPLAFLNDIKINQDNSHIQNRIFAPDNSKYQFLVLLFNELKNIMEDNPKSQEQHKAEEIGLVFTILGILFSDFSSPNKLNLKITEKKEIKNISAALSWIDKNYFSQISNDDLSEQLALSTSYFEHVFKDSVGETPMNYLKQVRIAHARQIICNENITMTELATRVGFANVAAMNKAFKEIIGITPYQYKLLSKKAGFDIF